MMDETDGGRSREARSRYLKIYENMANEVQQLRQIDVWLLDLPISDTNANSTRAGVPRVLACRGY